MSFSRRKKGAYYTVQEGTQWVVYERSGVGTRRLCAATSKHDADKIVVALEVFELSENAAREIHQGSTTARHRDALTSKFSDINAQRKRERQQQEVSSCVSGFVNIVAALFVGLTIVTILIMIFQRLVR